MLYPHPAFRPAFRSKRRSNSKKPWQCQSSVLAPRHSPYIFHPATTILSRGVSFTPVLIFFLLPLSGIYFGVLLLLSPLFSSPVFSSAQKRTPKFIFPSPLLLLLPFPRRKEGGGRPMFLFSPELQFIVWVYLEPREGSYYIATKPSQPTGQATGGKDTKWFSPQRENHHQAFSTARVQAIRYSERPTSP